MDLLMYRRDRRAGPPSRSQSGRGGGAGGRANGHAAPGKRAVARFPEEAAAFGITVCASADP